MDSAGRVLEAHARTEEEPAGPDEPDRFAEGDPAERMSMLALLPPPLARAFYVSEERQATVTFRVRDLGIARYGPVFERVEAGLARLAAEFPAFTFHLTGSAVWRWRNLYQIVVDRFDDSGMVLWRGASSC